MPSKSIIQSIKIIFRKSSNLLMDFFYYFHQGWKARLTVPYAKSFVSLFIVHLNQFRRSLYSRGIELHSIRDEKIKKLQTASHGLHSLLPSDGRFSYSILMLVSEPDESFLRRSLESALSQSAPSFELLIAFINPLEKRIEQLLFDFQKQNATKVQIFDFSKRAVEDEVLHQLAQKATGNFLFFMGEEDWIRPDLLFRYEQTLRLLEDPENSVLTCDFNRLSGRDAFIPCSECCQPAELCFPYIFKQLNPKGILIAARLWKKLKSHSFHLGAPEEDLFLRLDLEGAVFQHVPICLYSVGGHLKKPAKGFIEVLENYTQAKGLAWKWGPGYHETSARALPPLPKILGIQVIIPFKDQKELTLKCMHSILKQNDVPFRITAVDNRSADRSIAEEIIALGGRSDPCR